MTFSVAFDRSRHAAESTAHNQDAYTRRWVAIHRFGSHVRELKLPRQCGTFVTCSWSKKQTIEILQRRITSASIYGVTSDLALMFYQD